MAKSDMLYTNEIYENEILNPNEMLYKLIVKQAICFLQTINCRSQGWEILCGILIIPIV